MIDIWDVRDRHLEQERQISNLCKVVDCLFCTLYSWFPLVQPYTFLFSRPFKSPLHREVISIQLFGDSFYKPQKNFHCSFGVVRCSCQHYIYSSSLHTFIKVARWSVITFKMLPWQVLFLPACKTVCVSFSSDNDYLILERNGSRNNSWERTAKEALLPDPYFWELCKTAFMQRASLDYQ